MTDFPTEYAEASDRLKQTDDHITAMVSHARAAQYDMGVLRDELADVKLEGDNLTALVVSLKQQLAAAQTQPPLPAPVPADEFNGGTTYPAAATVNLEGVPTPVGSTIGFVRVTLDKPSPNTVIARLQSRDGSVAATRANARSPTAQVVTFRPGDPLEQIVPFGVANLGEGKLIEVNQVEPDGAKRGTSAKIIGTAGVSMPSPVNAGRAPERFNPQGTLIYNATGREVVESGLWLDRLAHGRTQVGNGETGYYHPDAVTVDGDDLVLRSYRLDEPVRIGSPATEYPFAASMMSGLMDVNGKTKVRPELTFKNGAIEWEAKMPNRLGSWPALWLLGVKNGWPQWPPEIDVFEGFYFGGEHKPGFMLSNNLHGGPNGSRKWVRGAMRHTMQDHGLEPTLDTAFHKFACTVSPEWITMFCDEIETFKYANPFDSTDSWYPLMNVAVKANPTSAYDQGSGEMTVRRVRIWRA